MHPVAPYVRCRPLKPLLLHHPAPDGDCTRRAGVRVESSQAGALQAILFADALGRIKAFQRAQARVGRAPYGATPPTQAAAGGAGGRHGPQQHAGYAGGPGSQAHRRAAAPQQAAAGPAGGGRQQQLHSTRPISRNSSLPGTAYCPALMVLQPIAEDPGGISYSRVLQPLQQRGGAEEAGLHRYPSSSRSGGTGKGREAPRRYPASPTWGGPASSSPDRAYCSGSDEGDGDGDGEDAAWPVRQQPQQVQHQQRWAQQQQQVHHQQQQQAWAEQAADLGRQGEQRLGGRQRAQPWHQGPPPHEVHGDSLHHQSRRPHDTHEAPWAGGGRGERLQGAEAAWGGAAGRAGREDMTLGPEVRLDLSPDPDPDPGRQQHGRYRRQGMQELQVPLQGGHQNRLQLDAGIDEAGRAALRDGGDDVGGGSSDGKGNSGWGGEGGAGWRGGLEAEVEGVQQEEDEEEDDLDDVISYMGLDVGVLGGGPQGVPDAGALVLRTVQCCTYTVGRDARGQEGGEGCS